MSLAKDRAEFIAIMVAEGMDADDARLILRDAATIQRLAVEACNRELSASEIKRDAAACKRIRVRCYEANMIDDVQRRDPGKRFEAVIGGDPRGACVKIKVPSGRTNDWGHTGICVPTRGF